MFWNCLDLSSFIKPFAQKFHPGKSLVLSSNEIGVKKLAAVSSRRSAGSCLGPSLSKVIEGLKKYKKNIQNKSIIKFQMKKDLRLRAAVRNIAFPEHPCGHELPGVSAEEALNFTSFAETEW